MPKIVKHVLLLSLVSLILMLLFWSIPENYGEFETSHNYKVGTTLDFYSLGTNNAPISRQNMSTEETKNASSDVEKAVIIMFDRAYDTQFTNAKPILDKYGFKVSFFVICSFVEGAGYHKLSNGSELKSGSTNALNWDQIRQLYEDGHDIQSHGMEHKDLRTLSLEGLEYEIGGSKECLENNGLKPTYFQYPSNKGGDNATILKMVSNFFDFGLAGHSTLMFLNCDGWINHGFKAQSYKYQQDCNPINTEGKLTRTHKYAMREWSHDREHSTLNEKNPHLTPHGPQISDLLFNKFVSVVEAQNVYNSKAGKVVAIPIIGYHQIHNTSSYDTSEELFDREMNYLYDSGFKVLKLTDLGYNDTQNHFYIK
ncbi:MAG TPA: polysaccharide deacetylase family protein [Nitrososphaeraceae archaeon]|nr:polysaccharide deacetylase family protein [Nitrososphaeraceae archaeon]